MERQLEEKPWECEIVTVHGRKRKEICVSMSDRINTGVTIYLCRAARNMFTPNIQCLSQMYLIQRCGCSFLNDTSIQIDTVMTQEEWP